MQSIALTTNQCQTSLACLIVGMSLTPMVSKLCNYPHNLPVTNTIIMAFSQGAIGGLVIKIGKLAENLLLSPLEASLIENIPLKNVTFNVTFNPRLDMK